FCRDLRDNRVAVGAQFAHSLGYPMIQRLNSGFNWSVFSVSAFDPFRIFPESGGWACSNIERPIPFPVFPFHFSLSRFLRNSFFSIDPSSLDAVGVAHPVS